MNKPKVSVVMITYNHENFIKEAIESVLEQEFSYDYEIIIGEDKSPDNSRVILKEYEKKYPEKIKVFYREKNMGPINNFYDMFLKAKGEYIVYLEGDDYWIDKHKLQKQVEILENNSEYFGCFHIVNDIENGKLLGTYPSEKNLLTNKIDVISNPGRLIDLIRESNFIGTVHINSIMFRNEIDFNNKKIVSFIKDAKMIADLQLQIVILTYGKLKLLRESMAVHRRVTKENWTSFSSQKFRFIYEDYSHVLANINGFLEGEYSEEIVNIINKYDSSSIIGAFSKKDYRLAIDIFKKLKISYKISSMIGIIKYSIRTLISKK